MLDKIKQFLHENFQLADQSSGVEADDRCVRVAIAALLVEMASGGAHRRAPILRLQWCDRELQQTCLRSRQRM